MTCSGRLQRCADAPPRSKVRGQFPWKAVALTLVVLLFCYSKCAAAVVSVIQWYTEERERERCGPIDVLVRNGKLKPGCH